MGSFTIDPATTQATELMEAASFSSHYIRQVIELAIAETHLELLLSRTSYSNYETACLQVLDEMPQAHNPLGLRLGPVENILKPLDNSNITTLIAKHYASTVENMTKKLFVQKLDLQKVEAGKGEIVKMVTEQPVEKRMESFVKQVVKDNSKGKGKGKGGTVATDG